MIIEGLLVAVVMYIAWFSNHGLGQPMIERPLVLGALVGIVLGKPTEGVTIGAALELIFLGSISVGGTLPVDVAAAGVLGTAYAILLNKGPEVAITLAVPISLLAVFVYNVIKLVYTAAVEKFDAYLDQGRDTAVLNFQVFLTLFKPFVFSVVAFLAIALGTSVIQSLVNAIPPVIMQGLAAAAGVLPALGFAILLKTLWNANIAVFFFVGFAMVAYLKLPIMGVAIFAGAIAGYICISEYSLNKTLKSKAVTEAAVSADDKEDFFNA